MLRATLKSLYLSVKLTVIALFLRIPGWRYPLLVNTLDYLRFHQRGELVECMLFNYLKYHTRLHCVLSHTSQPFVLVVGIKDQTLCITGYCLIPDDGGDGLEIPTHSTPGAHGLFYYHHTKQGFFHAKRPTSVTRQMGFYPEDPIFHINHPLTQGALKELELLPPEKMIPTT